MTGGIEQIMASWAGRSSSPLRLLHVRQVVAILNKLIIARCMSIPAPLVLFSGPGNEQQLTLSRLRGAHGGQHGAHACQLGRQVLQPLGALLRGAFLLRAAARLQYRIYGRKPILQTANKGTVDN